MDAEQVAALRAVLAPSGWLERTSALARALRRPRSAGGLLVVGPPDDEPWHLAAHLDEESRLAGLPGLTPTLVRWVRPPGAPAHLSVGMQRLEEAAPGETVFVVSAEAPGQLRGRPARRAVPARAAPVAEPRPGHGQRPRPRPLAHSPAPAVPPRS